MVETEGVLPEPLGADFREEFSKICRVGVGSDGHFVGGALDVAFEGEHVGQVDLELAVGSGEDLVRVGHEVLVGGKTVANLDIHRQYTSFHGGSNTYQHR